MKILFAIFLGILMLGCISTPIKKIQENPEDYLGEEIYVEGTVHNAVKIGSLSGFTLKDDNYSIRVSSQELPKEGTRVMVKGVVMKEILVGYYVLAKEIN
ncbi:hypothetical protein JXA56_03015 [Candidatus Micrarchaeota archaeon]|nr:hypothetical protein [Candidatus Micrarchaeota archaeon]